MPRLPTIHRDRDLVGATLETLARALLRSRFRTETVRSDKVSIEKVSANHTSDGLSHLSKRS